MKKSLLCVLAFVSLLMGSCNTFIGVGRDLRLAGEGMEKAAQKSSGGSAESTDTATGGAPIY